MVLHSADLTMTFSSRMHLIHGLCSSSIPAFIAMYSSLILDCRFMLDSWDTACIIKGFSKTHYRSLWEKSYSNRTPVVIGYPQNQIDGPPQQLLQAQKSVQEPPQWGGHLMHGWSPAEDDKMLSSPLHTAPAYLHTADPSVTKLCPTLVLSSDRPPTMWFEYHMDGFCEVHISIYAVEFCKLSASVLCSPMLRQSLLKNWMLFGLDYQLL